MFIIKAEPTEVYIIERLGKFYKTISDGTCFLVPLIDNVKNIVNLEDLVQETEIAKTFLPNDNEIYFKFKIFYHINDPIKAKYETPSINLKLRYLTITTFRDLVLETTSNNIDDIEEIARNDLKIELNKEVHNFGCEIDKIEIEFVPKQ